MAGRRGTEVGEGAVSGQLGRREPSGQGGGDRVRGQDRGEHWLSCEGDLTRNGVFERRMNRHLIMTVYTIHTSCKHSSDDSILIFQTVIQGPK